MRRINVNWYVSRDGGGMAIHKYELLICIDGIQTVEILLSEAEAGVLVDRILEKLEVTVDKRLV